MNINAEKLFKHTFLGDFKAPILCIVLIIILSTSTYILYKLEKFNIKQNIIKQKINMNINDDDIITELKQQQRHIKYLFIYRCFIYFFIIINTFIMYLTINTITTAKEHGSDNLTKKPLSSIVYSIKNSPIEDILPSDKTNIIVIYYRFGCKDCELIYNKLKDKTENVNHIYWVATRSEQGIDLRKTYPITEVPTGIYIDENKKMHEYLLYTKSTQNNKEYISLNENNLNELISHIKTL